MRARRAVIDSDPALGPKKLSPIQIETNIDQDLDWRSTTNASALTSCNRSLGVCGKDRDVRQHSGTRVRRGAGVLHKVTALFQVGVEGAVGVHRYLADQDRSRAEDGVYYAEGGRARSEWLCAPGMEIPGAVTAEQFVRALHGRDPLTGELLLSERSTRGRRITAWSGLFAAPPEVTLLVHHGRGVELPDGRDVGEVARGLWEEAVDEAFAGLWRRLGTRAGPGGAERLDAVGWWVARYWHETNRDGWFHSHVHYILPNCVQGADGVWRTVDSRRLLREQKLLGAELQAGLRRRFAAELGVAYDHSRAKDGIVPAVGVDPRYVDARSGRHRAVRHYLAVHGPELDRRGLSARAQERYAEQATRPAKDTSLTLDQLGQRERARLAALGLRPQGLVRSVLGRARQAPAVLDEPARQAVFERLAGPQGLTEHATRFNRRDLLVACLTHSGTGTAVEAVDLARAFLSQWAVPTEPAPGADPAVRWYTTAGLVAAHDDLQRAWSRLGARGPVAAEHVSGAVEQLRDRGVLPSPAQERAIRQVCGAPGGVLLEGPPGSGKTSVVAAGAVAAARQAGLRVVGTAVALQAATGLAIDCHLRPDEYSTLASLLSGIGHEGPRLLDGTLLIVDEASMLGVRSAAQLLTAAAAAADARVLLVGDPHQAPPVEAGSAWAVLTQPERAEPASHVRLTDLARQADPAEREAVALLRAGETARALTAWHQRDQVRLGSYDATLARIATSAATQIAAGSDVLVLTATRHDAARLSADIRSRLHDVGHLAGPHHRYGLLELTVGDQIVFCRNDYQLGARNGARATVTAIHPDHATARLATGEVLRVPANYLARHAAWSYAINIHPAQGQTADIVHVLATPTMYRELALVAGSRHRRTITWHMTAGSTLEHLRGPDHPLTLTDAITWLNRSHGESSSDAPQRRPGPQVVRPHPIPAEPNERCSGRAGPHC